VVAAPSPRSSRSASGGLRYLMDGQAHDGTDKPRSWFVDGLDCSPETADQEWRDVRRRFDKDGVRPRLDANGEPVLRADGTPQMEGTSVQAVHLVLSYDVSEYDPSDPEAILAAHQQSTEVAERIRAGHQVVLATQTDGIGSDGIGKVHTHIYMSAVHPETGRSANGRHPAKNIGQLRRTVDEVSLEHGRDNAALMSERSKSLRVNSQELARREAGEYVWKDDLHQRLEEAMSEAATRDQFKQAAADRGVEVRYRGKTGVSYGFTDADKEQRSVRARGLGSQWMAKGVDVQLEANRVLQLERERVEQERARQEAERAEQQRIADERERVEQERSAAEEAAAWDFAVPDEPETPQQQAVREAEDAWNFEVPDEKPVRARTRERFETKSMSDDYGMGL